MREAKLGTVKAMQKQQAALVAAYAKAKAAESKARGGSARANDLIHRMWKIRAEWGTLATWIRREGGESAESLPLDL